MHRPKKEPNIATTVVLGSGRCPVSLPSKGYPDIYSHPTDIYSHPKDIYSYPKASPQHLHSIFKTSQKEKNQERKGCTSITEMFRKAIFSRWPMLDGSLEVRPGFATTNQEEKKEEREKSPHSPLKEKEARKEENNNKKRYSRARTREATFGKPTVEEIAAYCSSRNNGLAAEQIYLKLD